MIEAGGVEELDRLVRELPDLLQRNTDLLTEAERMLREEQESDSSLRTQHGARSRILRTGLPLKTLTFYKVKTMAFF